MSQHDERWSPYCHRKQRETNRGDTIIIDTQVLEPAAPAQPLVTDPQYVPANITGWFVWFTMKFYYPDQDSQAIATANSTPASLPAGGGVTITNPTNGQIEVQIPTLATRNFPDSPVKCIYDVKVQTTDSPPRVFTVESGDITVYPNVTRAGS